MAPTPKLSRKKFIEYLRKNSGLYAQTAAHIQKDLGIHLTRQAVRKRALNLPSDILIEIEERNLDIAEGTIIDLMTSDNDAIRLKAVEYYLNQKGRSRGFTKDPNIVINQNKGIGKTENNINLNDVDPDLLLKLKESSKSKYKK